MTAPSETQRRKDLRRAAEARQRVAEEAALPVSRQTLWALFDALDVALGQGCDHSLRFTGQFLAAHGIPPEQVIPWLGEYGGYCDCEVLANVEEHWGRE